MCYLESDQRHLRMFASIAIVLVLTAAAAADQICGDINGNGQVDPVDLDLLWNDFGCDDGDCIGDVDVDGDTDQQDLAWLLINFGCPDLIDCIPCQPRGNGTMEIDLLLVDNSSVGPGDDPQHPEFDGGVTHFTFNLMATIAADNDWTTQASMVALLTAESALFEHELGGDTEPAQALLPMFPALAFDSFFDAPPALFDAANPKFMQGPIWTPPTLTALWFDEGRHEDVAATTQRFTLVLSPGAVPEVLQGDCAEGYLVLAAVTTQATSAAMAANLLQRQFLIVDLSRECSGDIDRDGDVDQSDLGILLSTYNLSSDDPQYNHHADLDCDGDVDQADLGTLLANYGEDC